MKNFNINQLIDIFTGGVHDTGKVYNKSLYLNLLACMDEIHRWDGSCTDLIVNSSREQEIQTLPAFHCVRYKDFSYANIFDGAINVHFLDDCPVDKAILLSMNKETDRFSNIEHPDRCVAIFTL